MAVCSDRPSAGAGAPRLSIVIPAYNVAAYLAEAVESLRAQTVSRFEVIIVNDGSTDATGRLADTLVKESANGWPRVKVIHQANLGQSAARNAGIHVAASPLVGFLDGDDRWWPEMVARHLEVMDHRPDIDLTCTWWRIIYDDGDGLGYAFRGPTKAPSYEDLICANTITLGTVVARAEAIEAAGGFEETLTAFEDWDLWLRMLRRRPHCMLYIPEVLADYRYRDGQITSDWRKMDAGWRRVMEKRRLADPDLVERLWPRALANHLSYCSMLAYKAGDKESLRRLVWRAWSSHPSTIARGRGSRWITQVALATLLPAPVQATLRRAKHLLGTKRFTEGGGGTGAG